MVKGKGAPLHSFTPGHILPRLLYFLFLKMGEEIEKSVAFSFMVPVNWELWGLRLRSRQVNNPGLFHTSELSSGTVLQVQFHGLDSGLATHSTKDYA